MAEFGGPISERMRMETSWEEVDIDENYGKSSVSSRGR
jgi:hypothetical protein